MATTRLGERSSVGARSGWGDEGRRGVGIVGRTREGKGSFYRCRGGVERSREGEMDDGGVNGD
jgi:hypothetical protein